MIDAATSVLPSPPKRVSALSSRGAADDFRTTLDTVADKPAARADIVRHEKKDDAPPSPQGVDPTDVVDSRTCGTSRPGKGQGIAGGGKSLPRKVQDEDQTKQSMWLPVGMIALPPTPATCPLVLPPFGGAVASSAGDTAITLPAASPAEAGTLLGEAIEGAATSADWAPFAGEAQAGKSGDGVLSPNDTAATDGVVLPAAFTAVKAELPMRIDVPTPALPQAMPQPATQPAGQAFAAAIAAAIQAQPKRDEREPTDTHGPLAVAGAPLDALHMPAIAAAADAGRSALDLRQDSGLQGMIDHIELLRDNADAGDTRIRLVPDALGTVDVSVRRHGDRVHVHFDAENATSARLLSEAQPRLADLAEARGVKLGQTSVDSGGGNRRQPPSAPPLAAARPPAPAAQRAAADAPIADMRLA